MATDTKPNGPVLLAEVSWQAADIKQLRPKWSVKRCNEWLEDNENHIQCAMIETGWAVIRDLLAGER